jgi:hypothetical protein
MPIRAAPISPYAPPIGNCARSAAQENVEQVEALLWDIASGIEQGGLAERRRSSCANCSRCLSEALAQGAPQDVIDALLQRYRDALAKLPANFRRECAAFEWREPTQRENRQRRRFRKAAESDPATGADGLARSGAAIARDDAKPHREHAYGARRQRRHARRQGAQRCDPGLSDLTGRQRALLDKTFREKMGAGDPNDGGAKGLAQQQGKLRDDLNKVLKGLGDQKIPPPDTLGQAGHDMGSAQNQLGSGIFDGASDAQKNALDDMRKAAGDSLAKIADGAKRPGSGARRIARFRRRSAGPCRRQPPAPIWADGVENSRCNPNCNARVRSLQELRKPRRRTRPPAAGTGLHRPAAERVLGALPSASARVHRQ